MTSLQGDDAPDEVRRILATLGIGQAETEALERSRPRMATHFVVRANENRYFLKMRRPAQSHTRRVIRRLVGSPTFERQVAANRALAEVTLTHVSVPNVVSTDGATYVLLEYVTRRDPTVELDSCRIVDAIMSFQQSGTDLDHHSLGSTLLDWNLAPRTIIVGRTLTRLMWQHGLGVATRCLATLRTCDRAQPPTGRRVLVHNDLHPQNLFEAEDGRVFLIDFENVTVTDKWYFQDVVHYAVGTHNDTIDTRLIRKYLESIQTLPLASSLVMPVQVRFALLRRIVQHVTGRAPPRAVRLRFLSFLTDCLLSDDAYEEWYAHHFE